MLSRSKPGIRRGCVPSMGQSHLLRGNRPVVCHQAKPRVAQLLPGSQEWLTPIHSLNDFSGEGRTPTLTASKTRSFAPDHG